MDSFPATIDGAATDGDALAPFAIEQPDDVVAWLRRLCCGSIPVHLASAGGAAASSTIWSIDVGRQRLAFDAASGAAALAELVDSDDVTAVSYLDDVKLQFDLHDLMLVHGSESSALQARLPLRLYRFQRRGTFRVRAPARLSPTAEFRHPGLPDMRLALRVLDVSASGCALLLPDDVPGVAAGVTISGARIRLGTDASFDATLQVLHVTSIQPGMAGVRLGCAIVALPGHAASALQRYVDWVQRRQRPFGG